MKKLKSKEQFFKWLLKSGKSKKTANIYTSTLKLFENAGYEYTFESICSWKEYLVSSFKPATVNLRIQAMNSYLGFNSLSYKIKPLAIQPQQYVENQLTDDQYKKLLRGLWKDEEYLWWAVVKLLATTGVRISEFLQITKHDVENGYANIIGKGNKARRIWIPKKVQKDILSLNLEDGLLIKSSDNYVRAQFLKFGCKYSIPLEVMHPHELRSFYARNVYNKTKDLRLLQNLLGHSNVATTMRYLRQTSANVGSKISEIVDW